MFLIDNNLSPKLATRLSDIFPGAKSALFLQLESASDEEIWASAKSTGFSILTKDRDFDLILARFGFPPKVVRLNLGNISTNQVEEILRAKQAEILSFLQSKEFGILTIRR